MIAPRAVFVWCVSATMALAQETEAVRAFVDVELAADQVYLQQACEVTAHVGIDAEWFAAAAVPLFQQALDQPFQVVVPWLRGAEDRAVTPVPAPAGARTQRLVVGDAVVAAEQLPDVSRGGRRFSVFRLRYRWLPLAAGTSPVDPVELRYAFATRFDDDFLRGRQPLDRQEASVWSEPPVLHVRALPFAGRPSDFTGAVGEFTVQAATAAERVRVGDTFEVELRIAGDGNLARMAPLPPPALPGFHVQGVRDLRRDGGRTFALAVVALRAGASELPPLPFAAFSPARGAYVVHHTAPLPLVVEPHPAGADLPPALAELVRADAEAARADTASPWWGRVLVVALVLLAVRSFLRMRRRSRRRQQLQAAVDEVVRAGDGDVGAVAAAFTGLRALCGATGDASADAAAQALGERLEAARFGGVRPGPDELRAVSQALADAARRRS